MLASAIITAPRQVDYLPGTLASVKAAGFDPIVVHDISGVGPNDNYRDALGHLLATSADWLVVFQDDILVAKGLADWLRSVSWPDETSSIGCLSLYCATSHAQKVTGWWRFPLDATPITPQPKVAGALAFVWPRKAAERFLIDPPAFSGRSKTDMLIGAFCSRRNLGLWTHYPSLVQHVGRVSTFGDNTMTDARRADSFVNDVAFLKDDSCAAPLCC